LELQKSSDFIHIVAFTWSVGFAYRSQTLKLCLWLCSFFSQRSH
jgi:hypothetical protein